MNCSWLERDIRNEDVLDLGEKFNDVLFVSRKNVYILVERSTVNTNDILVLGEKIYDSLLKYLFQSRSLA